MFSPLVSEDTKLYSLNKEGLACTAKPVPKFSRQRQREIKLKLLFRFQRSNSLTICDTRPLVMCSSLAMSACL